MAITPATTDKLFEIGACIYLFVVGRKVIQDFRCSMNAFRSKADALFFYPLEP